MANTAEDIKSYEPNISSMLADESIQKLIAVDNGSVDSVRALMQRTARERQTRGWGPR